jgi:rhombotail lipoprotein
MQIRIAVVLCCLLVLAAGCASNRGRESKQSASVVDFLYPGGQEAPKLVPGVAVLKPPVKVGIAFAPTDAKLRSLPEAEKLKLLERTKAAFMRQPYVGTFEIVPTQYLKSGGGFDNLDQVSRMFGVDIMALVSYDQIHFTDSNAMSMLYWTIIGAYLIHGDEFDIKTMLDISVFDVASRKLLFRAPGVSQINGGAAMANYSERARNAQIEGYGKAIDDLIPKLTAEIESFRARLAKANDIQLAPQPGYQIGAKVQKVQ